MNRDKNSYVLIYAAVMVILAAVLLAGAAIVLRPAQQENANIDKMQQILRALGQSPDKSAVISTYKDLIKKELLVNEEGQVVKTFEGEEVGKSDAFNANTELSYKLIAKGEKQDLPVYVAEVNGKTLYVLPLNGAGLWNKIWGYIAIDAADHSTVDGADFGNAGETPDVPFRCTNCIPGSIPTNCCQQTERKVRRMREKEARGALQGRVLRPQ